MDMRAEYGKVIESFFWVCKVNKQTICNEAVPEDVLASVKNPLCKAWNLKLSGKDNVDPMTLVPEPPIAAQKDLDMVSLNPNEILKLVKGELKGKTPIQVKELKITIVNICRSQALAHRHAADAANHLVMLTDIASIPAALMVINAVQQPVVAVKILEVDEMMQRAQDKVDAIRRVKIRTGGVRQIDEVIFRTKYPDIQHGVATFLRREGNKLLSNVSMQTYE